MLSTLLLAAAACAQTVLAAPAAKIEERQAPEGVPDYVLKYGECEISILLLHRVLVFEERVGLGVNSDVNTTTSPLLKPAESDNYAHRIQG
jgi:hypothetical protein